MKTEIIQPRKEWRAYLNGEEIPIKDCLTEQGGICDPKYMKDGDCFELRSPLLLKDPPYIIKNGWTLEDTRKMCAHQRMVTQFNLSRKCVRA